MVGLFGIAATRMGVAQPGARRHKIAPRPSIIIYLEAPPNYPFPMEGPHTRALADHLNELLTGKLVEQIVVPEDRWQANVLLLNCVGQVIQRVRSHGKWLFFDFSHGITWLCQLITRSKWTIPGEDVRKTTDSPGPMPHLGGKAESPSAPSPRRARREPLITLYLRNVPASDKPLIAVLTGHPIFYTIPTDRVRNHPEIRALGPDPLTSPSFYDDFPYRLRQSPGKTVAASLLDQEIVAGIGNTLKCEILYAMHFPPSMRVGALLASQVDQLAGTVVGVIATATTFAVKGEPYPYRVYDRAGMACAVCGTEIAVDRSGQDGHLTWYCPGCQPMGDNPTLFGVA